MHANHREDVDAGPRRRHRGRRRPQVDDHGRHPVPTRTSPVVLESIDFPEPVIDVAIEPKTKADQEKLGDGPAAPGRRGPHLPRAHRRGDRPDHHRRHGRAAPRDHRRPSDARVRRRRQRRPAAGGLPRDRRASRSSTSRAGSSARPAAAASTATSYLDDGAATSPARATRSRTRSSAAPSRGSTSRPIDDGIDEAIEGGVLAGFPMVDVEVQLVDGSYHDVDSSEMAFKIAGSMAFKEAAKRAKPGAARAGHGGRGGHARGVHRRRDRRPQLPPRADRGHGAARQRAGHPRQRAAGRDVRLRHRRPLHDARVARRTPCSSSTTQKCPAHRSQRSSRQSQG